MNVKLPIYVFNTPCLKCGKTERKMIKVGLPIFCESCFKEEFKTDNPVDEESKKYKYWFKKWMEK